jgi:hypothetical protein
MTRTFKTPEELAERLRLGEKWEAEGYSVCYYDESRLNPYLVDNYPIAGAWCLCDGETEWTLVEPEKKYITERRWMWLRNDIVGRTAYSSYLSDSHAFKYTYAEQGWYKATEENCGQDMYIDVKVEV